MRIGLARTGSRTVDSYTVERGGMHFAGEDIDWALVARLATPVLIFAVAIVLRLPHLMEVPGFTDETIDVQVALDALHGQWPLVDADPYVGALFGYISAAGFFLFGQEGSLPRTIVTVLGAGTVVLAFYLARTLAGTTAAVLTASMLATSGVHAVNGHIAWSSCVTPFFMTAAMLALVQAVARSNGPLLLAAGALYGLALQTHPSVIFLAPALAAHALFKWGQQKPGASGTGQGDGHIAAADERGEAAGAPPRLTQVRQRVLGLVPGLSLLRAPWPYLAGLAVALAMSNVIAYNLLNPVAWDGIAARKEYAYVADRTIGSYTTNLAAMAAALLRMSASSFGGGPALPDQAAQPENVPYLVLLISGVVCAVRQRHLLPLAGVAVTALGLPYINKNYELLNGIAYLGFLFPLLYVLMAMPLASTLQLLWRRTPPAAVVVTAACILLVTFPAFRLFAFYDDYLRNGATNPTILAIETEIRARYRAGIISDVLLDPQLDWVYTAPGGRALRAFNFLFGIENVPHRTVWMEPGQVKRETTDATKPVVLIVSTASLQRLGDGFGLTRLEVADRPYLQRDGYWAYLLRRP